MKGLLQLTVTEMKIAIIEPVGGHGGMNYYDFALSESLKKEDIDVVLYTSANTKIPEGQLFKVIGSFEKIWGDSPKLLRGVRFIQGLLKSLFDARREKASLIHFHFFHNTMLEYLCMVLAKRFGFTTIITAHDIRSFIGNNTMRLSSAIYRAADGIITHNHLSKKTLLTHIDVPERKVVVIPHGNYIDSILETVDQDSAKKVLDLPSDSQVVLFFGQIKEVKGLDLLLRAMPEVIDKYPELILIIAGKVWKDNFKKYERMIHQNCLENNVALHIRYIPDHEVKFFFHASDLVVLPYKKIYQSGVLLMSMSYGKPVLASDIEGMKEVISDNRNGFLFKSGDKIDLADKMITILGNEKLKNDIAHNGYMHVIQYHGWDSIAKQTSVFYRKILNGK